LQDLQNKNIKQIFVTIEHVMRSDNVHIGRKGSQIPVKAQNMTPIEINQFPHFPFIPVLRTILESATNL